MFAQYLFAGWIVYIEKYGIVKNYLLIEYRRTDLFLINKKLIKSYNVLLHSA